MRIYYYAYSSETPGGGQKQTYRHVDVLESSGYDAVVLHSIAGYRLKWFENSTRVTHEREFAETFRPDEDFLVLPEPLGMKILEFPGRKIIFNKNVYLGFRALPVLSSDLRSPYQDGSIVGAFVVSPHNQRQLRYAYPDLPIWNVGIGVDTNTFTCKPLTEKQCQIACVAKCPGQLSAVLGLLQARMAATGGSSPKIILLDNMTEREVAETLRESLALLALSVEEGMPQTIVEAALCGCILVAPYFGALKDWPGSFIKFDSGEPWECAEVLYTLTRRHPIHPPEVAESVERNYLQALRYSHTAERSAILDTWRNVLSADIK